MAQQKTRYEIPNFGRYEVTLQACFNSADELPVPAQFVQSYAARKEMLEPKPAARIPPKIQAFYIEGLKVQAAIAALPKGTPPSFRQYLRIRLGAIYVIKNMMIGELLPPGMIARETERIPFAIDGNWNIHFPMRH
jgi:hypothetical protein